MKTKIFLSLVVVAFTAIFFSSCQNGKDSTPKSYEEYKSYVRIHKDSAQNYFDQKWEDLEQGYEERKSEMEKSMDQLNAEAKEETAILETEWEEFKADYNEHHQMEATNQFRASLVPADVVLDFSNVGADRLLSVYQYFVDYVDKNKDVFTREQWDEIKIMWERLDTRKNEVEKDLPAGDNNKIAGLKIKFGAIKSMNRPASKEEENEEAKAKQ